MDLSSKILVVIAFVIIALFLDYQQLSSDLIVGGNSPYTCTPSGAGTMATCEEK